MPLKFYFDTHIAKQIAVQLRQHGVEVIRCEEVGMAEASDEEHLIYATQHGCAMVSIDKHFPAWHRYWMENGLSHAGIFAVHRSLQGSIGRVVTLLFEYTEMVEQEAASLEEDISNQLTYIR